MNLRKVLFILPNLFTLSSIFCGFYAALICASSPNREDFYRAALLIVFAMFFDTIDGRVARLTKTQSAFGVQIDSLADVCSFGMAPALLVYQWALAPLGSLGVAVAFVFVAAGAIRLARFNVLAMSETGAPKKPSKFIVGLPIPGAAGILVSLVLADRAIADLLPGPRTPMVMMFVTLGLAAFMVSTVPFRSFKDLQRGWRTFSLAALAIVSSVAVALRFHIYFALVWLLACYITIALCEGILQISQRRRTRTRKRVSEPTPVPATDDRD